MHLETVELRDASLANDSPHSFLTRKQHFDQVHVGQEAEIRFPVFNQNTPPAMEPGDAGAVTPRLRLSEVAKP